jgi:two-component system sensor histidine kinase KdpD
MLKAAQEAKSQGADIVIGLVETHDRAETAALMAGIPIMARRALAYRGSTFEELDLDGILQRRPKIVLVDELAHTNIPGSRHGKRWQDIVELLDAGIEVYTTMNIQHLESRKETVEAITGITVHETVPDSVLDRASQVILIDITPGQLLERLRQGKVYLGDRAELAREHFFKEDRLTALREIALRFTAERVDSELHGLRVGGEDQSAWRPTERLMVAISHSPFSEQLIRATRRLSYGLEAPWIAVHVDTGQQLSTEDRATLSRNIALVHDLGGELVSTTGTQVADELEHIARERQVTQLIMGRPTRRFLRDLLSGGTLLDTLARKGGAFDIHVVRPEKDVRLHQLTAIREFRPVWKEYLYAIATVIATGLLSAAIATWIGYRAVGFVFLFATLGFSLFASLGPILLCAALSAVVWNYFFIPPVGTFVINEAADWFMCAAYFVVAAATGGLTHLIRHRERMLRKREHQTGTLYEIVRLIATSGNSQSYLPKVARQLGEAINCHCAIAPVCQPGDRIGPWHPEPFWEESDVEEAVAQCGHAAFRASHVCAAVREPEERRAHRLPQQIGIAASPG